MLALDAAARYEAAAAAGGGADGDKASESALRTAATVQNGTFVASIVVQTVALALSIAALVDLYGDTHRPFVLELGLWIELVPGVVQISWYLGIAVLYYGLGISTTTATRYIDWALSTPAMLISLYLITIHLSDAACMSADELVRIQPRGYTFSQAMVTMVVADEVMLAIGALFELNVDNIRSAGLGTLPLVLAHVPLGVAFAPLFLLLSVDAYYSVLAGVLVTASFVVWLLYGATSVIYFELTARNQLVKNAIYNVLDVLAKNVTQLLLAILVLTRDENACSR